MPRRVNLTILLGLIIVVVLSYGLSASARPGDSTQGDDTRGTEPGDGGRGGEDEVGAALSELERLQRDVGVAQGEYSNAAHERDQTADDIVDLQTKLADAGKDREKAERELADTASEVYRSGDGGLDSLLAVLVGGDNSNFLDRLNVAGQLLTERKDAVSGAEETERKLTDDLDKRRNTLQDYQEATDRMEARKNEAELAEAAAQDYLDSLDTGVRDEIKAQQDERSQAAEERKNELLGKNAEAEETAPIPNTAEKLAELNNVEEQSKQKAADMVMEADQADGPPDAPERQAAEQAATEAAKKATAAEQASRVAQESAMSNMMNGQDPAKEARRLAEQPLKVSDTDGTMDAGDKVVVEGDFSIKPGATVTLRDADGTTGTAIDGVNSDVEKGSIDTTFTGEPVNVAGGDGVLGTEGLEVVDTTGIDMGSGEAVSGQDATGTAGLQFTPVTGAVGLQSDPTMGTAGLQSTPVTGTAGLQSDPAMGAAGLQSNPATAGTAGLQPDSAMGTKGGLQPGPAASGAPGLQPTSSSKSAGRSAPTGSMIIQEGLKYLGRPYVHGGAGPNAFDCSGFTRWVYGQFGVALPDSPAGQMAMGRPVPVGTPGALLFWDESGGGGEPTHVGLDMGDGNVLHASIFAGEVTITPIGNIPGLLGARVVA